MAASLPWGRPGSQSRTVPPCCVDLPTNAGPLRAEGPFQGSWWYGERVLPYIGRHSQPIPLISPMSSISTKGLLKGAALAIAGAATLGAGSAFASAPCPTAFTSFGSLPSSCTFGVGNNFTFTLNSQAAPQGQIRFFTVTDPNRFRVTTSPGAAGSFNFSLTSTAPEFFTSFTVSNPRLTPAATLTGTVPEAFTLTSPGTYFTPFPNNFANNGILTADYSFIANSTTDLLFTTDVPVPLPVVGAGLAFGFTRKLRKRAKNLA
jgi:hypothetical protein